MNAESIQNCFYNNCLFSNRAQLQSDDGTKELQVILTEVRCDVSADEYMESDGISITYTDNKKDLPHDIYKLFTIISCDYHLNIIRKGVTASRLHSHVKKLRWGLTNVADPNLKRKYQELIRQCGVLYKQSKLSFVMQQNSNLFFFFHTALNIKQQLK